MAVQGVGRSSASAFGADDATNRRTMAVRIGLIGIVIGALLLRRINAFVLMARSFSAWPATALGGRLHPLATANAGRVAGTRLLGFRFDRVTPTDHVDRPRRNPRNRLGYQVS